MVRAELWSTDDSQSKVRILFDEEGENYPGQDKSGLLLLLLLLFA